MKTPEPRNEHSANPESNLSIEKTRLTQLLRQIKNEDFYTRLDVRPNATKSEIEKAFRKKAVVFHPDDKPEELKDIYDQIFRLHSEAKNILTDNDERRRYDFNYQQPRPTTPPPKTEAERKKFIATGVIKSIMVHGATAFEKERDEWVKDGVVTRDEINTLPEVKENAIRYIKSAMLSGADSFIKERDGWEKAGVVTRDKINTLPEVREKAKRYTKLMAHNKDFPVGERYEWVKAGIITEAEADEILRTFEKT